LALDAESRRWNAPLGPFAIADGLYYVGAADVTSYLFVTEEGLVLLDSGFAQTAPQVAANIAALGFELRQVRYIITSQAHYDHVGGVAELKRRSGAQVVMSAGDAALAARGGRGDFAFGDAFHYPPFAADRIVADGETLSLGALTLTAHVTPGHTKGCTTWTTDVVVEATPRAAVFVCGVTFPRYDLVDNPAYPEIEGDFRRTYDRLGRMRCEVFLAAHGAMFGLTEKRERLQAGDRAAFVDPEGCRDFIGRARAAFVRDVERQRAN
jgi:metallo-beta-lactamase class B